MSKQKTSKGQTISLIKLALVALTLIGVLAVTPWRGMAQADEFPWTDVINISASGSASLPAITVSADGGIHAIWWDAIDGELYSQLSAEADATYTTPSSVARIYGEQVVNQRTGNTELLAPSQVSLHAGEDNSIYAFWFNTDRQLFASRRLAELWGEPVLIAGSASTMDAYTDASGSVKLAYARTQSTAGNPAGLYFRSSTAAGWQNPALVYASPYFRTSLPETIKLSIAGDSEGRYLIAWEDQRLGHSLVRTEDAGVTWTAPEPITTTVEARISQPVVGAAGNGRFVMLWRNLNAPGCGITQRLSSDGGSTWTAPVTVLDDAINCPDRMTFHSGADNRLWLVALSGSADQSQRVADANSTPTEPLVTTGFLAAWDGTNWSPAVSLIIPVGTNDAGQVAGITCLKFSLRSTTAAVLGCSSGNDLMLARNAVALDKLVPAERSPWSSPQQLSVNTPGTSSPSRVAPAGALALTTDNQAAVYAVWSATNGDDAPGTAIYAASYVNKTWVQGDLVLTTPEFDAEMGKADQPSVAVDRDGRLHATFSGGSSGRIYYSAALARDATSSDGWQQPIVLPSPSEIGSWSEIVADPRGQVLYVLYVVPYNEQRGVWFTRSDDGGTTWSFAVNVADAVAGGWDSVSKARLVIDPNADVLHAAWLRTVIPGNAGLQAIYYARSVDRGQTWSTPQQVAEGNVDAPILTVAGTGQTHLSWINKRPLVAADAKAPYEIWNQLTTDAGSTWSNPMVVRGLDAVSGHPGIATDGAGRLFVVAVGEGPKRNAVLQYTEWNGNSWVNFEQRGLGQPAQLGNDAQAAVLSASGEFHVVMRLWTATSAGDYAYSIQAVRKPISALQQVQPLATFTPVPSATPPPTSLPPPTPSPTPLISQAQPPAFGQGMVANLLPAMLGVIVAGVVVVGSLAVYFSVRQRKHGNRNE